MPTVPDHPVISNIERTGYPDGVESPEPRCPICGELCDTIYRNVSREIVGCDVCIDTEDAWEVSECTGKEGVYA